MARQCPTFKAAVRTINAEDNRETERKALLPTASGHASTLEGKHEIAPRAGCPAGVS